MADRQGFEPWRRSPAYTLSRRAPSTTRPPVRCAGFSVKRGPCASAKNTSVSLRSLVFKFRLLIRQLSVFAGHRNTSSRNNSTIIASAIPTPTPSRRNSTAPTTARRDMIAPACSCAILKSKNTNPGINKSVNNSAPVITAEIVQS